jgi:hypothetical protein
MDNLNLVKFIWERWRNQVFHQIRLYAFYFYDIIKKIQHVLDKLNILSPKLVVQSKAVGFMLILSQNQNYLAYFDVKHHPPAYILFILDSTILDH